MEQYSLMDPSSSQDLRKTGSRSFDWNWIWVSVSSCFEIRLVSAKAKELVSPTPNQHRVRRRTKAMVLWQPL